MKEVDSLPHLIPDIANRPQEASLTEKAAERLMQMRQPDGAWDFHAHLGEHFSAQYFLCLDWLETQETDLSREVLKQRLQSSQLQDGSWIQVRDANIKEGELNATIFNYWFLKSIGEDTEQSTLKRARDFILASGGIEASSLFTKTFLALLGQYPWQRLTYIPYIMFHEKAPCNYRHFSQWVIPHLMPMAYLRANRCARDLGEKHSVKELWKKGAPKINVSPKRANPLLDTPLIEKILSLQQPMGSWGGYTVSTLMTCMALKHYLESGLGDRKALEVVIRKGLSFIDNLYAHAGPANYQGCLMDGHYWDTLLVANSLVEAGIPLERLELSAQYIADSQQANGGFPYGYDFEYAPDVDDTAEAILLLSKWPKYKTVVTRAANWLLEMQNRDGGWGAFDQNNVGNAVLRTLTKPYMDSVDLFDDSSADSTGHVLDALSVAGYNIRNSEVCRNAVAYLFAVQEPESGLWIGRWAINYIFGTTCALVGLLKAGVPASHPKIENALKKILANQNRDGGFGEGTDSYLKPKLACVGVSTPSQTGWVLWALCAAGQADTEPAHKAARYLAAKYDSQLGWQDDSVTGTGHPGLLYMVYPSYAQAFPLIALSLWKNRSTSN